MKLARIAALALIVGALGVAPQKNAHASVSVAATFDGLVAMSDAVVVATPLDANAQYEDGKIWTYTRLHVENAVAGDAATGGEVYVRAFGGTIGRIGMVSEGEPSFTVGKPQLLFLRHTPKAPGAYQVTANAQGQFQVVKDPLTQATQYRRSPFAGLVVAPKDGANRSATQTSRVTASPVLAIDMIENRAANDVSRDIASAYRRLHATQ